MQHTFFKKLLDQILKQSLKGHLPKILLMMKINGYFSSFIIFLNKQSSCNKYHFNNLIKLRGGGCVTSVQERSIDKVIQNDQKNLEISLPDNFLEDLNKSLKLIVEQSKFIGDNNQRNAVLMKIQWFIYNREYLNSFCIDKKETSKIYELIQEHFQSLLIVLTTYLRSSGFICYQVLLICNELLRIIFSFQLNNPKRFFEETAKQDYLQHIAEFNTQLEIEQANVWKTGIEFEITMIKIMIMNSKSNSTQGTDLLLNFFQETAKSIISLSPSENLLQSIIDGGQYLLKKGIKQKLYPKETYQTYYLFQLIKWSIIRQLKSKQSVYKQIQFLKDIFQQYISDSNNWILHFSWIQMITDVIAYRPIINKISLFKKQPNQSVIQWNLLIENNLIKCVSYNKNEAIISIFQDEQKNMNNVELSNLLQEQSKQKFLLFSQFLLKGDLIQNINLWDYYKDFAFKSQKQKKQKDYEIILASYEQEIIKKLFNNLKSEKDEIIAIYSGILQSFVNYFNDSSLKQIFQDDQQALIMQFLNKYKKMIIIANHTQEMSKFEVTKLQLLNPYIQQFNNKVYQTSLQDLYTKIDNFVKVQLKDFLGAQLDYFLNAIEFTCSIYEASIYLETKQLKDLEKLKQIFQFDNFQNIFLNFEVQFEQFNLNLSIFKENFMKFIYYEKQVQQIEVMLLEENIINIIDYNCYGEYIKEIHNRLQNEKFQKKFKLYNTKLESLEDLQSNFIDCQFNIVILQYLKQFYKIQYQYLQITNQQFQNQMMKAEKKLDQGYKERVTQILTLQKQKISSLLCLKDDQTFQINCKSLLAQIENDFILIINESDQLQNKNINQQLLKLLTDAQFRIYQVINQTENISEIETLLNDYNEKLEQINKYAETLTKNISQDFEDKNFDFYALFQECNDQFITQTKKTKNYYKQFKKMLKLKLDLILQQSSIFRKIETTKKQILQDDKLQGQQNQPQEQEQQNISIFIQEFKDRRDNYFSEKLKSQISNSLFNSAYQKKEQIIINLKLTNFLYFFYSLFFSSQFEQVIKGDNVNDSIWQDIKNAYKDIKENIFDLIKLKPDHKVREGLVFNLIRLQNSVQEQQITSFTCKILSYIWVFEKDQRVRNLLKNKELIEFQKQLFSQTLDIQNGKESIILILDSYDEMKQDCIQQNLLMTNKLFQDLNINKVNHQMKVIITTRKEILNTTGYQTWFYGESISTLKEIQLQNFNEAQQNEYLNQYVVLSIKRKIKEVYEFVKSVTGQMFDLEEFLNIWSLISSQITDCIKKSEINLSDGIFQPKEEEAIIKKVKTHKTLKILKEEQTTTLQKELLALWNVNKFKKSIQSINIQQLLTTPFMLEIIVQVLPNMARMYTGTSIIKDNLIKNYMKLQKQTNMSLTAREFYQKEYQPFNQNNIQNLKKLEDEKMLKEENDQEFNNYIEKTKIDQIIDKLESQNFFQNYSIVSILNYNDDTIIFDGYKVKLNPDDINLVIMSLKMKKFTVFEFYDSFISFYHEQQIHKQRDSGKISNYQNFKYDIFQFSYSLAIDMTIRELSQINYKPQGKLDLKSNYKIEQVIDDWLKQYFDVEDEYKKLIRSCILLSAKGSSYSFTHKSIQEFYVAKYIYDLLVVLYNFHDTQNGNVNLEKNKQILLKSVFNDQKFNISTENFKNVINFIKEMLINDDSIIQKLIEIVQLSRTDTYCRSASNSIYLLKYMNVFLGSKDFNNIELANTNISGLSFFDCDLSHSKFQNVEINSCNLNFTDLSNVKWLNVICNEKPFLKGHKKRVTEVKFSQDGQYIISSGEENEIKLWNAESFKYIQDLEGHTGPINSLSFSSDSSILLSGSDDRTIRKWNLRDAKDPQIKIKSEILVQFESKILQIQLSKDQKKLYVLDKEGVFLILTLQKDDLSFFDNYVFKIEKSQMELFALNPIEPIVAIVYYNGKIELINYSSKQYEILKTFIQPIKDLIIKNILFSPDGNYLAISTRKGALVWDIKNITNQFISEFNFNYIELQQIQFDQKSEYLVFITNSFVFKQELKQQKIQDQEKKIICLEFATYQNGNLFAIVQEKKLIIKEFAQIIYSKDFDLQPKKLKFSSDGSKLSFFLLQDEIKQNFLILDIQKQEIICNLNWNNQLQHLCISNNFEKLLILFKLLENEAIQIEGCQIMDTKKINQDNQNKELDFEVEKFCVKANSSLIAYITFDAESIKIYDINLNKHLEDSLVNDKKKVYDFQFSPSQNQLAAVYKGELVLYNLDSKPISIKKKIFQNDLVIQSINYSPDGTQIGLVFRESFQIYHQSSDNVVEIKDILSSKEVTFSIDNKFIGFINQNQRIMILNKDQNNQNKQLDYPNKLKLIFTQDNKAIITGGENKLTLLNSSSYQIIKESLTFVNFEAMTFSHNLNLICLLKDRVLELWEYSNEEFKYLGSQLYDLPIKQLDFINNGQQILILNQNSKLRLQKLNCFQNQQIFQGCFCAGGISNTGQIALADEDIIKIYDSQFQQTQTLNFDGIKYLEFFEINQNQLLIILSTKIIIYNYKNDEKSIIYLQLFVQNDYKVNLYNDLIIFQQENVTSIWNASDFKKIQLCGYHENIYCFSILENEKYALGIKDGQEIEIKDAFNVIYAHPNENTQIYQIIITNEQYIILTESQNLLVYQIDQKSTIEFQDNVLGITYFKERNQIAIITKNKIQLIEFSMNQFNIIDSFDFDHKAKSFCNLSISENGETLLINSSKFIHLIHISNSRKLNYQQFYFSFEGLGFDGLIKQIQMFSELGTSNKQHYLVSINNDTFKIQELQNCNKTVQISSRRNLKKFELSLDEKFIFFVVDREGWIFNNKIYGFTTANDDCIQINSFCKAVGGDSYIFLNKINKIVLLSAQTTSSIEIDIKIDEVTCIEFLSQQNVLVLSTVKNNIICYDYKAKKIIGTLKGHWKTINSMAVSTNGSVLASASDDQLIKVWNINQNETQEIMQAHLNSISALAFSQDGQILASGSLQNSQDEVPIFLWDLIDKKLIVQLNGHQSSINCIEFSYCSRFLISGDQDGVIIIWNIQYPKTTQIIYIMDELNISINSLTISPKQQNFITICNLDNIQKWNFQKIKQLKQKTIILKLQKKPTRKIHQIYNFISDQQFIYVDSSFNLTILNIQTQKSKILEQNKCIFRIIPSKDHNFILCFEKFGTNSWQKNQEKKWFKQNLYIPKSQSNFILLSLDGQFLYIIEKIEDKQNDLDNKKSRRIQLYDMNKTNSQYEKIRYQFDQEEPLQGFLSLDLTLAIVIYKSEIRILDIKNRKNNKILKISLEPCKIAISDDNKYLAFCQIIPNQQNQSLKISSSIYIWEFQNQNILIPLEITNQNLLEIENFYISSLDSNKIYAIYSDGTVRNWNIKTKQAELINFSVKIPRKAQLKFSNNFQFLITCEQTCISVWQIKNPQNYFEIISNNYSQIIFSKNEENFTIAFAQKNKNNKFEIVLKNFNKQCVIEIQEVISFLIAFTNNDQGLIFCQCMKICLWKIDESLNYELIGYWQLPGEQRIMEFGYDFQEQELTVLQKNEIKVFKLIPAVHLIDFEEITIQSTCFSPDNKYFISINPFLSIYQIEDLQTIIQNQEFIGQMIQFQSNEILVILNNKELQFINISKIDKIEEIKKITYQNQICDIVFSLNYSLIQYKAFENSKKIKKNNPVKKYTLNQNNKLNENFFLGIFHSTKTPLFSQNGQYFALDNHSNNIKIVSTEQIKLLSSEQCSILDKKINHGQIFYSPCGELIYLFTHNSIKILDSNTMNLMIQQDLDFEVKEIEICQNWNYFALMGLNFVKIYLFQNNKEFNIYRTIEEDQNTIKCIALSPKGDLLLTGLQNQLDFTNSISLWNIKECKMLCTNNQIHDQIQILKFYPNGTNFAVGLKDGSVNLFSIDIKQTNYYKKIESKKNENTQNQISQINDQYKIFCYQSFAQQSLLYAQECILSESTIMSDQKSIIEILHQKGAKG